MLSETAHIPGPWVAESYIADDVEERGLAVIAVLPELERIPGATPTRGMVAWVNAGTGACATDEQAIATARLISKAPAMLALLKFVAWGGHAHTQAQELIREIEGV